MSPVVVVAVVSVAISPGIVDVEDVVLSPTNENTSHTFAKNTSFGVSKADRNTSTAAGLTGKVA